MDSKIDHHDNQYDQIINDILADTSDTIVPASVESRLRSRLAGFRQQFEAESQVKVFSGIRWMLRSAIAAAAAIALAMVLWIGLSPSLTLAQVQEAIQQKPWVHIVFDNGRERWISLTDHKSFYKHSDGHLGVSDYVTNTRLSYWPESGTIYKSHPVLLPDGSPPSDAMRVAPKDPLRIAGLSQSHLELPEGEAPEQDKQKQGYVERHTEAVDGQRLIRFDVYMKDILDQTLLIRQVWVDPDTRLPVRVRERLQLGMRQSPEDVYSDGRYDFPETGPADIYAIGAPADAPIVDSDAPAPEEVLKLIEVCKEAQNRWPGSYRVIQWPADKKSAVHSSHFDVIWWDGKPTDRGSELMPDYKGVKVRAERFFNFDPKHNEINRAYHLPIPTTSRQVLDWIATQPPVNLNISDGQKQYLFSQSHPRIGNPKPPMLQVSEVRSVFGFNSSNWPTDYLWPLVNVGPSSLLLVSSPEVEPGTFMLRSETGNRRTDFHLDSSHDMICVKETWWEKPQDVWVKRREYELVQLDQLPDGQWYAPRRKLTTYDNPERGTSGYSVIWNVDVILMQQQDFPQDAFNGRKLLEQAKEAGADIETQ